MTPLPDVVAWELANQATRNLAAREIEEAAQLASLGLTLAENILCLWILCLASANANRAASRHFAHQLAGVADKSVSPDIGTASALRHAINPASRCSAASSIAMSMGWSMAT